MLIRACSGLRSSIIQQAGLFSIQLVLLLVVMVVLVVGWGDWEEGKKRFYEHTAPHRAYTRTQTHMCM